MPWTTIVHPCETPDDLTGYPDQSIWTCPTCTSEWFVAYAGMLQRRHHRPAVEPEPPLSYAATDLDQRSGQIMDEANAAGRPVVITHYKRARALLVPLDGVPADTRSAVATLLTALLREHRADAADVADDTPGESS